MVPHQYKFPFSGIGNSGCSDCTGQNATWTVSFVSACLWQSIAFTLCGGSQTWRLQFGSGSVSLETFPTVVVQYQFSGAYNCMAPITLTCVAEFAACTGWPLTVVVSPV